MAKQIENEVVHYYDLYPTKEDLMGETALHDWLIDYLKQVLRWFFREQTYAVYANLNFYQTHEYKEEPLAPDIAVIKGVNFQFVTSWNIGKTGSAPQVVFEIGSAATWKNDIDEKPQQYARMGVQEYFAYDPNQRPLRRGFASRLFGWQLDRANNEMREMSLRPDGSLWSTQLNSLLVPDGQSLRLYDSSGRLCLTRAEALAEKLRSLGIDPDQI